ncbi:hypothetical protein EBR43_09075 [bacterium]|nr:hypothetical protein [bacterium]
MEQIMPFIFGMLTIIGIAAAATIVVGIVKIFKQTIRFRHLDHSIECIWSHMSRSQDDVSKTIDTKISEIYRSIDLLEERLSNQLSAIEDCIDTGLSEKELLKG